MCLYYTLVCVQIHTYITYKTMHWCLYIQANIYLSGAFLLYRSVFFIVHKYFLYWGNGKKSQGWLTRQHSSLPHSVLIVSLPSSLLCLKNTSRNCCYQHRLSCKIWGSQSGIAEDSRLLASGPVQFGWMVPMLQRHQVLRNVANYYPNDTVSLYKDWIFRLCLYVNRIAMW